MDTTVEGREFERTVDNTPYYGQLKELIKIRSIYGKEPEEIKKAADKCAEFFGYAGLTVEILTPGRESTDGGAVEHAPLVYGSWDCGKPNAPTVLLYAHYDVVSAGWKNAFEPGDAKGRITGRGSADDKAGIMMHVATCQELLIQDLGPDSNPPPVNLKVLVEGEEEVGTPTLANYIREHHEKFRADVISLADGGNIEVGKPTLTTSLRGFVQIDVKVSTLKGEVHSGMYGGPAPDAFMALTRMLAKLHDNNGNVAVPGLRRSVWTGHQPDAKQFRKDAKVLDGVKLIGTGSLGSRLYSKPSINVVALEGPPPIERSRNVLQATATARLSVRLHPEDTPDSAFKCIKAFLTRPDVNPWGVQVSVTYVHGGRGFLAKTQNIGYRKAEEALKAAYQATTVYHAGQGASIPPASALGELYPDAAILVWGCEEPSANIHADCESVSRDEFDKMKQAQIELIRYLGDMGEPPPVDQWELLTAGAAAS